jgi:hypothetical protein
MEDDDANSPRRIAQGRGTRRDSVSELEWRRSSSSGDAGAAGDAGESIEIAFGEDGLVHIRETGDPDNVATTTQAKWDAFVKGVKAGEFDHFAGL